MKLFLDTSVLLAACGWDHGASAELFRRSEVGDWSLLATGYVLGEVERNLGKLPVGTEDRWPSRHRALQIVPDVFTLDRPSVFGPAKDRPVLFSALAWADVLLTLDRVDFAGLLGRTFYNLPILKPGDFLRAQTT